VAAEAIVRAGDAMAVLRPRTLRDALRMLRDEGPLTPLAGGTDLLVAIHAGALPAGAGARRFIDLWRLDELRGIAREGGKRPTLTFGALTTFSDCIRSAFVHERLPILAA